MTAWKADDLSRIGRAEEIGVASRRSDGSLTPFITIWAARLADDLYVRSAHGPDNGWYRRARAFGSGRIRAGGVEHDVDFVEPDHAIDADLSRAYHAKYDRHGAAIVGTVVSPTPSDRRCASCPDSGSRRLTPAATRADSGQRGRQR